MDWYLVHSKPRQEKHALLNLEQQGYECYLPIVPRERLRQRELTIIDEPLFPRYLFVRIDLKSWGPIRSTTGVSRLVCFGAEPARIDDALIRALRLREQSSQEQPQRLLTAGERLVFIEGAFSDLEAIFQMQDGEGRVMVLIELLSKPVQIRVPAYSVRKLA